MKVYLWNTEPKTSNMMYPIVFGLTLACFSFQIILKLHPLSLKTTDFLIRKWVFLNSFFHNKSIYFSKTIQVASKVCGNETIHQNYSKQYTIHPLKMFSEKMSGLFLIPMNHSFVTFHFLIKNIFLQVNSAFFFGRVTSKILGTGDLSKFSKKFPRQFPFEKIKRW